MAKANGVVSEEEIRVERTGKRPPTVLEEYDRLRQQRAFELLRAMRGKIHLDLDIDELRGRNR